MIKSGKSKLHTLSIIIQWREDDMEIASNLPNGSNSETALSSRRPQAEAANADKGQHSTQKDSVPRSNARLLPSDRIMLDALRVRLPHGEQITTPVCIRELMLACEISRRQVQICLKRLSEKGFIKRLLEETDLGSTNGYRYYLSKDALRR